MDLSFLNYDNFFTAVTNFLEAHASFMPPWFTIVRISMWIGGAWLMVSAILKLRTFREPGGEQNVQRALWQMLFAALAINLDQSLATGTETVFGAGAVATSPLSYQTGSDGWVHRQFQALAVVVLIWIQFIGYIAFARGILILNRYKTQHPTPSGVSLGKGLTHMFGGVIACNLGLFSEFLLGT